MNGEPVPLRTVQGEAEAQQLLAFLRAHGIRAAARGEALRLTHGMVLDGLGEVQILVHRDDLESSSRRPTPGSSSFPADALTPPGSSAPGP